MIASILIFLIQLVVFIIYVVDVAVLGTSFILEMHSLMVGVFLFSLFACIPAFIWNLMMLKEKARGKDVVGLIFSVLAFVFAMAFLIVDFVVRIHGLGYSVF